PVIEGGFRYGNDLYHIKATHQYNLVKRSNDPLATDTAMLMYRDSDTSLTKRETSSHQCGFDNMMIPRVEELTGGLLSKRFEQGCPITKKINYMGAAADCTYVQYYKSRDAARVQIINDFNMASAVFEETFNVALGLINITIMDPTCPTNINPARAWNRACDANYSLGDRLSDFSLWRSGMKNDGAGLWHLMTNCPTGVEVGLAWLKQLCNTNANTQKSKDGKVQYVSGAGVSAITRDEWKVVAHEIGHGFGAIHDCTSDSCPCEGDACQCCPFNDASCPNPLDHARPIYELNVCGNGIMEAGEECDTGGIDSDCCDAQTCKLKEHAVCEDFNGACCYQCQIRSNTHMCRPAATPCDISEHCTGQSSSCPDDLYLPDGNVCEDGKRCASGQCTSRDTQCLSRGFVMNITESCRANNEECKMLCNKPDGKCLLFSGNFIDGTPCGTGGSCLSGVCRNGGATASMRWMREHQHIMIPVCIVAFLFLC
ncbi:Metallo-peptidase family M12-domain-containing protein, partial [Thamnidium elegans]